MGVWAELKELIDYLSIKTEQKATVCTAWKINQMRKTMSETTLPVDYAPGMRIIIRDEEWVIRKVVTKALNNRVLYCSGISALVKDRNTIFLKNLEFIEIVNPANIKLVFYSSPHFRKAQLFIESLWRQKIPTDIALHIEWSCRTYHRIRSPIRPLRSRKRLRNCMGIL